eukprot:jgi/Ulvmu1/630/UM001_0638.1
MRVIVPCSGARCGGEPLRQCRRCLCVKYVRDLLPELPWRAMQACPGHGRVARNRHAGMPRLMAALSRQCRALSGGTLEPVFVIEFPVQLRGEDLRSSDELLPILHASRQCMHGENCTAAAQRSCAPVLHLTQAPLPVSPREDGDGAVRGGKRTRFDMCVLVRCKRRRGGSGGCESACGGSQPPLRSQPEAGMHAAGGGREAVPVVMVEVAGGSIRNQEQQAMMLGKVESCLHPEVVQPLSDGGHPGGGKGGANGGDDGAGDSAWRLLFVAESDLDRAAFRKSFARRVLMSCMHDALWRCVPDGAKAHRLRQGTAAVGNSACVTYSSGRGDMWGDLLRLKNV